MMLSAPSYQRNRISKAGYFIGREESYLAARSTRRRNRFWTDLKRQVLLIATKEQETFHGEQNAALSTRAEAFAAKLNSEPQQVRLSQLRNEPISPQKQRLL